MSIEHWLKQRYNSLLLLFAFLISFYYWNCIVQWKSHLHFIQNSRFSYSFVNVFIMMLVVVAIILLLHFAYRLIIQLTPGAIYVRINRQSFESFSIGFWIFVWILIQNLINHFIEFIIIFHFTGYKIKFMCIAFTKCLNSKENSHNYLLWLVVCLWKGKKCLNIKISSFNQYFQQFQGCDRKILSIK